MTYSVHQINRAERSILSLKISNGKYIFTIIDPKSKNKTRHGITVSAEDIIRYKKGDGDIRDVIRTCSCEFYGITLFNEKFCYHALAVVKKLCEKGILSDEYNEMIRGDYNF